jgi:magnesium-transporting ATPase (P-type)
MCIVVGDYSCKGKIMSKLETEVEATPLQEKLEKIATDIGLVGMYAALITVHCLFYRFFIERFKERRMDLFGGGEDTGEFSKQDGAIKGYCSEWIRYFILGITIIVVAVPEGLPLAVMISLAYSVRKMLQD